MLARKPISATGTFWTGQNWAIIYLIAQKMADTDSPRQAGAIPDYDALISAEMLSAGADALIASGLVEMNPPRSVIEAVVRDVLWAAFCSQCQSKRP